MNYFSDYRSSFIDLLNSFSNCIRDLNIIFEEEMINYKEKIIIKRFQYIIYSFLDRFIYCLNENIEIFLEKKSQSSIELFKYNSQILMEMQLLIKILGRFINQSEKLKQKAKIAINSILVNLAKLKCISREPININERDIYNEKELRQKDFLLNHFLQDYNSFYKIFK